jgi:hypothetical protein
LRSGRVRNASNVRRRNGYNSGVRLHSKANPRDAGALPHRLAQAENMPIWCQREQERPREGDRFAQLYFCPGLGNITQRTSCDGLAIGIVDHTLTGDIASAAFAPRVHRVHPMQRPMGSVPHYAVFDLKIGDLTLRHIFSHKGIRGEARVDVPPHPDRREHQDRQRGAGEGQVAWICKVISWGGTLRGESRATSHLRRHPSTENLPAPVTSISRNPPMMARFLPNCPCCVRRAAASVNSQ